MFLKHVLSRRLTEFPVSEVIDIGASEIAFGRGEIVLPGHNVNFDKIHFDQWVAGANAPHPTSVIDVRITPDDQPWREVDEAGDPVTIYLFAWAQWNQGSDQGFRMLITLGDLYLLNDNGTTIDRAI